MFARGEGKWKACRRSLGVADFLSGSCGRHFCSVLLRYLCAWWVKEERRGIERRRLHIYGLYAEIGVPLPCPALSRGAALLAPPYTPRDGRISCQREKLFIGRMSAIVIGRGDYLAALGIARLLLNTRRARTIALVRPHRTTAGQNITRFELARTTFNGKGTCHSMFSGIIK